MLRNRVQYGVLVICAEQRKSDFKVVVHRPNASIESLNEYG
jgi:hypothetical protein